MIPYIGDQDTNGSAFLGFVQMGQNTRAVATWDYVLRLLRPKRIVELGTGHGSLTCLLGIACKNYGWELHSFDMWESFPYHYLDWGTFLGIHYYGGDIQAPEKVELIKGLIQSEGTTALLCDNGNKILEWHTFAPSLKLGDVIGGHDYYVPPGEAWPYSEITQESVSVLSRDLKLEPFMQEDFNETGWLVRRKM